VRQLHLERAFTGCRAFAEDVEDQASAVDDLAGSRTLQIALLHRRQCRVNNDDLHLRLGQRGSLFLDLTLSQQSGGAAGAKWKDGRVDDIQADRPSQPDRLSQPRIGGSALIYCSAVCVAAVALPRQDDGGACLRGRGNAVCEAGVSIPLFQR